MNTWIKSIVNYSVMNAQALSGYADDSKQIEFVLEDTCSFRDDIQMCLFCV